MTVKIKICKERRERKIFLRKLDILHLSWKLKTYLIEESAFILLYAPVFLGSLLCFNLGISKCWPLSFTFCQKWSHLKQDQVRLRNLRLYFMKALSWCHEKGLLVGSPKGLPVLSFEALQHLIVSFSQYVLCFLHSKIQWDVYSSKVYWLPRWR